MRSVKDVTEELELALLDIHDIQQRLSVKSELYDDTKELLSPIVELVVELAQTVSLVQALIWVLHDEGSTALDARIAYLRYLLSQGTRINHNLNVDGLQKELLVLESM